MTKKRNFKATTKGKKLPASLLRKEIYNLLKRSPSRRFHSKQIIKKLKIANSKTSVEDALTKLAETNQIAALKDAKFVYRKFKDKNTDTKFVTGIVDLTRSGSAYIVCEGDGDDVYIAEKHVNGAFNGDRVKVEIFRNRKGRRRPEGEVVEVLDRSREYFIGTLERYKNHGIVVPDQANYLSDVYIAEKNLKGAQHEDKVVVKITKWPNKMGDIMMGEITSVLGKAGSHDVEMKSILISNGFELEFPSDVIKESESLNAEMDEEEIERRRDMRGITTFTIDPDTARDFDDALSFEILENGDCEIGVHIADVTHYVRPNTALDKEAFKRSTSVYLVDRVLPMLPEKISNELCSLRPDEDKATFSAVFIFDKKYKIKDRWFGKTLIHSNRRFAYEEAQEVLESGEGDYAMELRKLNEIAHKLRKQKFKKGAIAFEGDEVKFKLDENGVPIEVYKKERKDAHLLIEDFMLLANREVATFMTKKSPGKEVPFIYRVHDLPDPDKVAEFSRFAFEMGFKMEIDTPQQIADSFNKMTKEARTNDMLKMLEPIAIRTMSKAEYTTNNIGHYGLAFENYSHFTSPIRRYSDVLAHRILEKNLDNVYFTLKDYLEEQCKHISKQERKAMSAERESVKFKQVEFMEKHVGEVFEGHIAGIIDRGFFVQLVENKCEGMVGFEKMNESFEIAEGRLKATGLRSKKVYKMGDIVKVKIVDTNLSKRQIDMELVI